MGWDSPARLRQLTDSDEDNVLIKTEIFTRHFEDYYYYSYY